jgi:hypothetical protein
MTANKIIAEPTTWNGHLVVRVLRWGIWGLMSRNGQPVTFTSGRQQRAAATKIMREWTS